MRLADFITANLEPVLLEWDAFARSSITGKQLNALALRDHADEILLATVRDMRSVQSPAERLAKSLGHVDTVNGEDLNGASEQHAIGRLGSGFGLLEVVAEYRALRASVLRQWHGSGFPPNDSDVYDVTRFNESIDQSLAKAVSSYTKRVDQSRDLFLAILGHDLRNPLNSILMSASLLPHLVQPATEATKVCSQISSNVGVMAKMISDLLDYTRTRLGAGMPVSPAMMDLSDLCQEVVNEFRATHPNRQIFFKPEGELRGNWDIDRLRQVVSNLLGNAIQHSPDDADVVLELRVSGEGGAVAILTVYNAGPPIPPGAMANIFDPLVRGSSAEYPEVNRPGSIGLGLYIARTVVESHGGTINVTSSKNFGTEFTVRLPRDSGAESRHVALDEIHVKVI
ncbi:sensor histidine kinase [Schlesneria sp. T3-172]|uniref:sensor histidine kinase n=1 Tax=Schlesneria sphaerica TaxID=3373610 RepID=UPI0037CC47D7